MKKRANEGIHTELSDQLRINFPKHSSSCSKNIILPYKPSENRSPVSPGSCASGASQNNPTTFITKHYIVHTMCFGGDLHIKNPTKIMVRYKQEILQLKQYLSAWDPYKSYIRTSKEINLAKQNVYIASVPRFSKHGISDNSWCWRGSVPRYI